MDSLAWFPHGVGCTGAPAPGKERGKEGQKGEKKGPRGTALEQGKKTASLEHRHGLA